MRNIITIGASAGGMAAVSSFLSTLKEDLEAAILVVLHVSASAATTVILNTIQKQTAIKCLIPEDGQRIENHKIYLAPADHHMLVERDRIRITKGPYENHWRPSIDVLFRSAAAVYSSCVTGVVLSGLLDDGASGMYAIKRSGGLCMVQDPAEAEYPDMPNSVLRNVEVDYKVPVHEMGYILSDLFSREPCQEREAPADVKLEAEIAKRMTSSMDDLQQLGDLTTLTCPDCGGVMVRVKGDSVARYRCYTGHAFTESILEQQQTKDVEESLWVAIRMLEERKNLLLNMVDYEENRLNSKAEVSKKARALEVQKHIDRLKGMLMDIGEKI